MTAYARFGFALKELLVVLVVLIVLGIIFPFFQPK